MILQIVFKNLTIICNINIISLLKILFAFNFILLTDLMDISTNNRIFWILKEILKEKLSDIHVLENAPVYIRDSSWEMKIKPEYVIQKEEIWWFLHTFLPDYKIETLINGTEVDAAYQIDSYFLRINAYLDRNWLRLAIRRITADCPSFESIGLPEHLKKFLNKDKWLILVTWPTWSGKSTTLAAMLDYINQTRAAHILTMEDPIEFVFNNKKSLITQREIWKNTKSFQDAMRYSLRQDPDVIMVWEMRDMESISSVLTLVETWHLVLSTLHTVDAAQTVTRIIDVFPPHKQDQVSVQLSLSLECVVSQRLLPTKDNTWRVAAREIMVNSPAIANNIRERKIPQMHSIIETWFKYGMKTMDQSLAELVMKWQIDLNTALPRVKSLEAFKILLTSMKDNADTFRPVG